MNFRQLSHSLIWSCLLCLLSSSALAANFTLSPVRLFFQPGQNSDIINIKNNSADEIKLQVSTFAWSQDENAKDVLGATDDLIAFPKLLSVAPGETRLLRVGSRTEAKEIEQLYRLYIEELPGNHDVSSNQASVRTLTKAGIPIFVPPIEERAKGDILNTLLDRGRLDIKVANSGNVHFMIRAVHIKGVDENGDTVLEREAAGWYLHPSKIKTYSPDIPPQACAKMRAIEIEITTDRFSRSGHLNVIASMCGV